MKTERAELDAIYEAKLGPGWEQAPYRPPARVPAGKILVHNHVRRTLRLPNGTRGFRFWYQDAAGATGREVCGCGWNPGPGHYRVSGTPYSAVESKQ